MDNSGASASASDLHFLKPGWHRPLESVPQLAEGLCGTWEDSHFGYRMDLQTSGLRSIDQAQAYSETNRSTQVPFWPFSSLHDVHAARAAKLARFWPGSHSRGCRQYIHSVGTLWEVLQSNGGPAQTLSI